MYTIKSILDKADDVYRTSRYLTVNISLNTGTVEMFLLHWSIELYLKAFLMNSDIKRNEIVRTHNLKILYEKCILLNSSFSRLKTANNGFIRGNNIIFWINLINPFNDKLGGVRYPNSRLKIYTYPTTIHNSFDPLINKIKQNVNYNKSIDIYLY